MKFTILIPTVLTLTLFLNSCATAGPAPAASDTPSLKLLPEPTLEPVDIAAITARSYPHVDGSTSTHPLQLTIACQILGVRCAWTEEDFFSSTRRIAPVSNLLATDENEVIFNINHSGTHGAYMNLIEKNTDLILVAREPSKDETDAAKMKRVNFDIRPLALDAFVFLAHVDNPVKSLSLEQIRDIYSGKITNWVELGGFDAEIHTYQRNPNSGSQELMEKLVMRGEAMLDSPDMILESMMGPFNAIRDDPLGIGYSVYFYAANIYPDENVSMIAIEGVAPNSGTIAAHAYPLVTEVYAVLRDDTPVQSHARILRDWLLTEEGQEAVTASGYVALSG
jgi:phosphate transport system substrate-binding protein